MRSGADGRPPAGARQGFAIALLCLGLIAAPGCRRHGVDSVDSGGPPPEEAGLIRVGTPAPVTGIYGIAAHPDGQRLYLSNLHAPFLTVVDSAEASFIDAVDLRTAGVGVAHFPWLYVHGEALWVTAFDQWRVLRFDLASHEPLEPVEGHALPTASALAEDGLWIAFEDGVLARYEDHQPTELLQVDEDVDLLEVSSEGIVIGHAGAGVVALLDRQGGERWRVDLAASTLSDLALMGDRVFACDRASGDVIALEDGREIDRVHTGSDSFGLQRDGDRLLVTNRQGASLPASGAYEGAPGIITALDLDLEPLWTAEAGKTIHFLAWDGQAWWSANEDSMDLTAVDRDSGEVLLHSERLGLTVDHLASVDGALFFGSHLTDELWRVDPGIPPARVAPHRRRPPGTRPDCPGGLWVPCQESGDLQRFDAQTLALLEEIDVGPSFSPACPQGLCSRHDLVIDAAMDGETLVFSDAQLPGLRWSDGRSVVIDLPPERAPTLQAFDVEVLDGVVLCFEPRSDTLHAVRDDAIQASIALEGALPAFPLVLDVDRVWAGETAYDGALSPIATLPDAGAVVAAGEGWLIVQQEQELVVLERAGFEERGRLPFSELRSPPYADAGTEPILAKVEGERLILGNSFAGTLEWRSLPDLAPFGRDEPTAVGRWAQLPGLW